MDIFPYDNVTEDKNNMHCFEKKEKKEIAAKWK